MNNIRSNKIQVVPTIGDRSSRYIIPYKFKGIIESAAVIANEHLFLYTLDVDGGANQLYVGRWDMIKGANRIIVATYSTIHGWEFDDSDYHFSPSRYPNGFETWSKTQTDIYAILFQRLTIEDDYFHVILDELTDSFEIAHQYDDSSSIT